MKIFFSEQRIAVLAKLQELVTVTVTVTVKLVNCKLAPNFYRLFHIIFKIVNFWNHYVIERINF